MPDRVLDVQKATVLALRSDAALMVLVGGRVYDRAPQDVLFPYVEIGSIDTAPALETVAGAGTEIVVTLHTWSRTYGRVEAARIQSAIYDAIHERGFSLETGSLVLQRLLTQNLFPDEDGVTTHGVQRFRFLTC